MDNFTTSFPAPLRLGDSIQDWQYTDVTRTLGRQYADVDLAAVLSSPDVDEQLRDLAITISHRGLVIFKGQSLTPQQQKTLTQKLGQLTGKPKKSGLHIHPINHTYHEEGGEPDLHMSTIARNPAKMLSKQTGVTTNGDTNGNTNGNTNGHKNGYKKSLKKQSVADGWHSDIAFERICSDYTSLINRICPSTGGDTIFASAYEVYDRISPAMRSFLETLTGSFSPVGYEPNPEDAHLYCFPRGHESNIDQSLTAEHPIVRTNPVTGWKSIFGVGHHLQKINGLAPAEEEWVKSFLLSLITDNHDLQARVKWDVNDVAIWDNRAVYHTATYDYDAPRMSHRVVAVGEAPALDPHSMSRSDDLGL